MWITQKGELKNEPILRPKTVEEVLQEPAPDQSWMTNPIPRESFYQWFPKAR
jgi:hypothetical protein